MKIDLHNHSKYSDGVLSVEELVKRAKQNNVEIFALTDHDSVLGDDEIIFYGKKYNVKIIKGMELSTSYNNKSVHIVCLFKNNIVPKEMLEFTNEHIKSRKERAIKMMNNIKEIYNMKIDLDKLFSTGYIITRANMARNISECNNITLEEASKYVTEGSLAYIPATKMSVKEGLELAKKANCFTILAHPCLLKEEYLDPILSLGFDAMEVRYANSKNNEEKMLAYAKKYNLMISAGSDCHGDSSHADIGTATLDYQEFLPIAKAINFKMED